MPIKYSMNKALILTEWLGKMPGEIIHDAYIRLFYPLTGDIKLYTKGNTIFELIEQQGSKLFKKLDENGEKYGIRSIRTKDHKYKSDWTESIIRQEDLQHFEKELLNRVEIHISKLADFVEDKSYKDILHQYLKKGSDIDGIDLAQERGKLLVAYFLDTHGIERPPIKIGKYNIKSPFEKEITKEAKKNGGKLKPDRTRYLL